MAALVLAVLAVACSGAGAHRRLDRSGGGAGRPHAAGGTHSPGGGSSSSSSSSSTGTSTESPGGGSAAQPPSPGVIAFAPPASPASKAGGSKGASTKVPVTASVAPDCVSSGGTETLTVHTEPGALVAYDAVYSDGKNGAVPPYGAGYGGNAYGTADSNGDYTTTWVVSPNAPAGKGYVKVYAGWNGSFGSARPRFAVADASGSC